MSLVSQWITLNAIDFYLTWMALDYGAIEGNPVLQFFNINSIAELALWKVAFVFGTLVLLQAIEKPRIIRPAIIMQATNRGMLVVCVWNALIIQAAAVGLA